MAEVTSNLPALIARLQARINSQSDASPQMRQALTRIGILISSEALLNVRRRGLIDTGRLINSLKYELFNDSAGPGVRVGSFGVPYAAVHEFGFHGSVNVPTHTRTITQAFGRPINARSVTVSAHARLMNIRARPYLRPAVRKFTGAIIDILREATRA